MCLPSESGIHTKLKPANSSSNIADSIIIFTVIAFLKLVLVIIVAIVVIIVILVRIRLGFLLRHNSVTIF